MIKDAWGADLQKARMGEVAKATKETEHHTDRKTRGYTMICKRLSFVMIIVSLLAIVPSAAGAPFGFFGIESALEGDYLEDLDVGFIRGNLLFSKTYSIDSGEWSFERNDDKFSRVYQRDGEMVVTFMSPTNMEKIRSEYYREFILRCVERYDGDEDYGCTEQCPDCYEPGDNQYPSWSDDERPAIKFWQMENEVDKASGLNPSYWLYHPEEYVELINLVYPLVKQACPDCSVLLGSFLLEDMDDVFYETLLQNEIHFDIVDFHRFGYMNKNHFKGFSKRIDFLKERFPLTPIWMTETSTYTDSPHSVYGLYYPNQSEMKQAVDLFKRHIHLPSEGVEKILWNHLYERPAGTEDGCFWYTGLIYDGEGEFDKGPGIKKLSYFTRKLMSQKLGDADWHTVICTHEENNVYQYLLTRQGKPIYVAWFDWFNDTTKSKDVTLDVSSMNASEVKITKVVPMFETGQEADTVPFEDAFVTHVVPIIDGTIELTLGKKPVIIEACGPAIVVSPTVMDFGEVPPGSSAFLQVEISNAGNEDLEWGDLSITGPDASDFAIVSDQSGNTDGGSGQVLTPSERTAVYVRFSPVEDGEKTAVLSIPSNDPDVPIFEVPLSGLARPEIMITDIYTTDTNGLRQTDFLPGEAIQFHIAYDILGAEDTQYKVKALIKVFQSNYPELSKVDDQPGGTGFLLVKDRYQGKRIKVPVDIPDGTQKEFEVKLKLKRDGQVLDTTVATCAITVSHP